MVAVITFSVWQVAGFNMIIYLAALASVPEVYYEASMIDGATWTDRFRHITWPLIWPCLAKRSRGPWAMAPVPEPSSFARRAVLARCLACLLFMITAGLSTSGRKRSLTDRKGRWRQS